MAGINTRWNHHGELTSAGRYDGDQRRHSSQDTGAPFDAVDDDERGAEFRRHVWAVTMGDGRPLPVRPNRQSVEFV